MEEEAAYEATCITNADNIIITLKHKQTNAIYESTFRIGDFKGADSMGGMKNVAKIVCAACTKRSRYDDDGISCTIYDYTCDEGYLRMTIRVDAIVSFTWDLKVLAKEYNPLEAKIEELMKNIEALEDRVAELEGSTKQYDYILIPGCPIISSRLEEIYFTDSNEELEPTTNTYIVKDIKDICQAYRRCEESRHSLRSKPGQCPGEDATYHLKSLTIKNKEITDLPLNFLKSLHNLSSLTLSCPKLRSIRGLEGCTKLREVVLEGCQLLKDVDELASLPELSYLNVKGTAVTSTRAFAFTDPCLTLVKDEGVSIDAVKRSLGI